MVRVVRNDHHFVQNKDRAMDMKVQMEFVCRKEGSPSLSFLPVVHCVDDMELVF